MPRFAKGSQMTPEEKEQWEKTSGEKFRSNYFVSKADAEANPELQEQYEYTMECVRKGHEAKKEKNKQKKLMKEEFIEILSTDYEELKPFLETPKRNKYNHKVLSNADDVMNDNKLPEKFKTVQGALCLATVKNAKENIKAMEFIRDTMGEKPTDKVQVDANIDTENAYAEIAKNLFD